MIFSFLFYFDYSTDLKELLTVCAREKHIDNFGETIALIGNLYEFSHDLDNAVYSFIQLVSKLQQQKDFSCFIFISKIDWKFSYLCLTFVVTFPEKFS